MIATLEKNETAITDEITIPEENKEELCKKILVNILEGLVEGYEDLQETKSENCSTFEAKINELKSQIEIQHN